MEFDPDLPLAPPAPPVEAGTPESAMKAIGDWLDFVLGPKPKDGKDRP